MQFTNKFSIQWVSVCLLLAAATISAQEINISHCLKSCPDVSRPNNEVVLHHVYAAAVIPETGEVEWVAYRVLPESIGVASLLPRWREADRLLYGAQLGADLEQSPSFTQPDLSNAQDSEYRTNEIRVAAEDRGRLTPMTSFAATPFWPELNQLSNMSGLPQSMRTGPWSGLDQAINELTALVASLYVVAGPVVSRQSGGLNSESGRADAFFKVVSDGKRVAAFLFDANLPPHAHFCGQVSSLAEIEGQVSLVLFPDAELEDSAEMLAALGCS